MISIVVLQNDFSQHYSHLRSYKLHSFTELKLAYLATKQRICDVLHPILSLACRDICIGMKYCMRHASLVALNLDAELLASPLAQSSFAKTNIVFCSVMDAASFILYRS